MLLWVLGQAEQPATGLGWAAGGWAGAGLLGIVMWWLLWKHLPEKDKQIERKDKETREQLEMKDQQLERKDTHLQEQLARKDAQIEKMLERKHEQLRELLVSHDANIKRLHEENQRAMERVIQHCKDEMSVTSQIFQKDMEELTEQIGNLSDILSEMRHGNPAARRKRKDTTPGGIDPGLNSPPSSNQQPP